MPSCRRSPLPSSRRRLRSLVEAVVMGPLLSNVLAEPQASFGAELETAGVVAERRGFPRDPEGVGGHACQAAVLRFDQLGIRSAAAQLLPSSSV